MDCTTYFVSKRGRRRRSSRLPQVKSGESCQERGDGWFGDTVLRSTKDSMTDEIRQKQRCDYRELIASYMLPPPPPPDLT